MILVTKVHFFFILRLKISFIQKKSLMLLQLDQTDYWNRIAGKKAFSHPVDFSLLEGKVQKNDFILDYGCGYGRTLHAFQAQGFQNTMGIDSSMEMIRVGLTQHPELNLMLNPFKKIPLEANSVSLVLLFAVLTCIPLDADQLSLIQEIKRVLVPDGLLYISDYFVREDAPSKTRYETFIEKYQNYGVFELPEGAVLRHHTPSYIQQLTASFQQQALNPIEVTTMNGNAAPAFQWLGRLEG
jgi:ubiquinone/menaquinone biosynthesis C-methylase UbiE